MSTPDNYLKADKLQTKADSGERVAASMQIKAPPVFHKLLFAKHALAYPRVSGHDVHAFHMMQACATLGHEVSLATVVEPSCEAIAGLPLAGRFGLETAANGGSEPLRLTRLQERFRSYFGIPVGRLKSLRAAAASSNADAVIVVGLDALPYFGALDHVVRVWYAADEWLWHHLSQLRFGDAAFGENVQYGVIKGLYERAYASLVDRAWVVSKTERRAMRWLAGMRAVDIVPNGVDAEFFKPESGEEEPYTAVFWGRLDFGPNVQAVEWFVTKVWPIVRTHARTARFTIVGFRPSPEIQRLCRTPGVSVAADLPDLRTMALRHQVVVLPFVSGGGIKNKLLEAAAMGKPIVCTPRARGGLRAVERAPLVVRRSPEAWARAIVELWQDERRRRVLGTAARAWVVEHHTWIAAARDAIAGIEASRSEAVPSRPEQR